MSVVEILMKTAAAAATATDAAAKAAEVCILRTVFESAER